MTHPQQIVFVVNGDAHVRQELRKLLASNGLYASTFESAAAYAAHPKPEVPACLLLDVELPDVCGLDFQQEIAGDCPPIVFVTRRADVAFSVRAIKEGAIDFLTIPFKPEQLVVAVRAALDQDSNTRAERARVNELRQRFARLTLRERQVLSLVASGMMNKNVASQLGITEITVQVHRRRVMQKMGARSFAELVRHAETLRIPFEPASHYAWSDPLRVPRRSEMAMAGR